MNQKIADDGQVEEVETEDGGTVRVQTRQVDLPTLDKGIAVAGHPRSGTSATCLLVDSDPETSFLTHTPGNEKNKYGYYEYRPVNRISSKWLSSPEREIFPGDWQKVHEDMSHRNGIPAWKVIRTASIYRWKMLVEDLSMIGIFREPGPCIKSTWKQFLFAFQENWISQNNILIALAEDVEDFFLIRHKTLLYETEKVADQLNERFGLDVDPSVIDTGEHHEQETDITLSGPHRETFETLCRLEKSQF